MDRLILNTETLALKGAELPRVESYDLSSILREAAFDWDKVVTGTHPINCFYNIHCAFNVYVKDGVALREEQPHSYPEPNDPDCPDFNPKGCNKGCAGVHRIYEPFRLRYPLKRVGARGEGRWKRVSWDEALDDIAETMLDAMANHGVHAVKSAWGTSGWSLPLFTFWATYVGFPDTNTEVGDHHPGVWEVMGKMWVNNSMDDTFYADMVCIWGGNPAYTLQTLYHYIIEARYRGAKVVTISVDYNPSALPADLWISVKPGSDAALAMSMCQVIIEEDLYDKEFCREQTDLPLLIRMDNRKYLRERDVKRGGREFVYYLWDEATNQLREAPLTTLELGGLQPALEGEWEVDTLDGKVKVRPVFSLFKERLFREYRPEQAASVCGVAPGLIRRFAREFAQAKGVVNVTQANFGKYYHGNIMERACVCLWALCGHIGKRGANWHSFTSYLTPETALGASLNWYFREQAAQLINHPKYPEWRERGLDDAAMVREAFIESMQTGMLSPTPYLWYFHGGLLDLSRKHNSWDPHLKRPLDEYVKEGVASRTKPVLPAPDRPLKVLINHGGNMIRRVRGNQYIIDALLPKLDLLVTIDWRWNTTCQYSDYILPVACCWYETYHHYSLPANTYTCGIFPFAGKAVEPPGEAKDEWWIWGKLFEKIQEKARARGIRSVHDYEFNVDKPIDNIYDSFSSGGLYPAEAHEEVMRDLIDNAINLEFRWEEYAERGWNRFTEVGMHPFNIEISTDIVLGDPIVGNTWHTEKKKPWPSATGRMHFYLDHDWYLELGEEFAWHKESIKAGGDYPLQVLGGHARWSVHTMWADSPLMLVLQRGEPVMFMSVKDAEERGIKDGDLVEVFNDVGRFQIQAVVAPAVRPGQVIIYHSWENTQFKGWRQFQQVMPSPFNPISFAPAGSEYPNVRAHFTVGYPGLHDRDSRAEVRKVAPAD